MTTTKSKNEWRTNPINTQFRYLLPKIRLVIKAICALLFVSNCVCVCVFHKEGKSFASVCECIYCVVCYTHFERLSSASFTAASYSTNLDACILQDQSSARDSGGHEYACANVVAWESAMQPKWRDAHTHSYTNISIKCMFYHRISICSYIRTVLRFHTKFLFFVSLLCTKRKRFNKLATKPSIFHRHTHTHSNIQTNGINLLSCDMGNILSMPLPYESTTPARMQFNEWPSQRHAAFGRNDYYVFAPGSRIGAGRLHCVSPIYYIYIFLSMGKWARHRTFGNWYRWTRVYTLNTCNTFIHMRFGSHLYPTNNHWSSQ